MVKGGNGRFWEWCFRVGLTPLRLPMGGYGGWGVGSPVNLKKIYLVSALFVPSGVIAGELGVGVGLGGFEMGVCGQGGQRKG